MTPLQCKMARTAMGWGVRDLARAANVAPDTVSRLERGEVLRDRTLAALRGAFEAAGIEFIPNGVVVHGTRRESKAK